MKLHELLNESKEVTVNGKVVDTGTLKIEGVDSEDNPKYVDAYIAYGKFMDGSELSEEECAQLTQDRRDVVEELIINLQADRADYSDDR